MSEDAIKIDNRKDILLLLLATPGKTLAKNEAIAGRTRLMKLVYLFYRELAPKLQSFKAIIKEKQHNFIPYNYGPFSKEVFDDIQFLENAGLLKVEKGRELSLPEMAESRYFYEEVFFDRMENQEAVNEIIDYIEPVFKLTEKGVEFTEKLIQIIPPRERKALQEFKAKFNSIPLTTLLRYVYTSYPESATESKISNTL